MEIDTKIAEWQSRFGEVVAGQAKTAEELRSIPTDQLHQRSLAYTSELAAIRSEIEDTLVELPNGKAINCGEYQALVELARLNGVEESLVLGRVSEVSGGRVVGIDLSIMALTDITPLAGLAALKELCLEGNQLTDVSPLAGLTALQVLELYNNQLTDISPLAGLTALQALYLNHNQLTDISPLAGLTGLEWLYLNKNQLTDIRPLAGLAALRVLHLNDNQLADFSRSILEALKSRGVASDV